MRPAVRSLAALTSLAAALTLTCGCTKPSSGDAATGTSNATSTPTSTPTPTSSASAALDLDASASDAGSSSDASAPATCPDGMTALPGGIYWMGSLGTNDEESPRHHVAVRPFCMDTYEITVASYAACVASGKCTPAHPDKEYCTASKKGEGDHPINCIDWNQAETACEAKGGRLPTEREWEYAARGGAEQRPFSWGSELPPGHSCYNHGGTCKVGSYAPGAFGLHDVTGNVWEWTASWFAPYPDEAESGSLKVYRGGSFSRRFPKWMRNALRNRYRPDEWGAHLGARCAMDLANAKCPEGSHEAETRHGCVVDGEKESTPKKAVAAAPAGTGGPASNGGSAAPASSATAAGPETSPVVITRDPQFDDDCTKWKPGRHVAYLVKGGQFADRQKQKGACVNRDVGVGFNSVCCAQ